MLRHVDSSRPRTCSLAAWFVASLALSACGERAIDGVTAPLRTDDSGPWRQVFAGYAVTCGVTKTDDTYCWGENERGELGDGTLVQRAVPTRVSTTQRFTKIAGDYHLMCGVTDAGDVYCWGLTPHLVETGMRARDVAVADLAVCVLGVDGVVSCWSRLGMAPARPTPVSATLRFRALAGREGRFCAVTLGGEAYCWTSDDDVAVGPLTREPVSESLVSIATGGSASWYGSPSTLHACGLTADGTAYCWGVNDEGQLGDGTATTRLSAVRTAGGAKFASIAAHGGATCGLGLDGFGYCWGFVDAPGSGGAPRVIPSLRLASLALGTRHICAVTPGGAAYCWGAGGSGQLGHGDLPDYVATPQRVLDP